MSVCPQCGSPTKDNDKFCNGCGFLLAQAPAPQQAPQQGGYAAPQAPPPAFGAPAQAQVHGGYGAPAQAGYGAPAQGGYGAPAPGGYGAPAPGYAPPAASPYGPPPGAGFGAPPPQQGLRCQQGHDIQVGASYCAMGHPIALDAMQFANDAYGAPPAPAAYQPPPPAHSPYGAPQQQASYGYGAPQVPVQPAQPFPPQQPVPVAFAPPPQPFSPQPGEVQQLGQVPNKILRGFLVSFQANAQGEFWPLHGGRVGVGRANAGEQVEIALADATISSRHAALLVDNVSGAISVEDTGSTNGTYVNDEHLGFNGRRELRDGDRLRFGGFLTMVKVIGRV